MSMQAIPARIGYFGKLPSRGDFVKASENTALIGALDQWLAQSMELLAMDARWRLLYDQIKPLHFAFMGPRSKRAIAGHLIASGDQAQRRFPFLAMSAIDIDSPFDFVKCSPMILGRLWNRMASLCTDAAEAEDAGAALQALSGASVALDLNSSAYDAAFTDFLELQTVGALDHLLAQSGFTGNLRQLLLALGCLLQPVMASSSSRLDKSLALPLPQDPMYRTLVATFWMQLIAPFLRRADFELALFILPDTPHTSFVLGFSGASPRTLHALMNPHFGAEHLIAFSDADWIESQIDADYGLKKLSTHLSRPGLSLKAAHTLFSEVFLGV